MVTTFEYHIMVSYVTVEFVESTSLTDKLGTFYQYIDDTSHGTQNAVTKCIRQSIIVHR